MRGAVLLAAALATLAAGAGAQTLISKQEQIGAFGACLVKQAPRLSEKLLQTPIASPDERSAAMTVSLGHNACIHSGFLSGRSGAIRGAVAQAMFDRTPALLDSLSATPPVAATRPQDGRGRELEVAVARCLVASDPKHSAALLRTPYATVGQDAFIAYGQSLSDCTPTGIEYHVDVADMRNQIAAVAWQAVHPVDVK